MSYTRVLSFDGNSLADEDYWAVPMEGVRLSQPDVVIATAKRIGAHPSIAGVEREGMRFPVLICIDGADLESLRDDLLSWLDPEEEETGELVIGGDDKGARYVDAMCEMLRPMRFGGRVAPRLYEARFRVDGDVRWRASELTEESSWSITASGQTKTVTNNGDCQAFPTITIKPTSNKTAGNGFTYKRWCPVVWKSTSSATNYPLLLGTVDTAALVTASKVQSAGQDWRVYVNGEEVDRWFGDSGTSQFNQTATKTWINMDFEAAATVDLKTAIAGAGAITEIEADGSISGFPSAGILLIESEAFVYTGKSNVEQKFTGVTREANGTSAAAHAAATTVTWIQHDVWIYYGDSTMSAPSQDDDYQPIIELDDSTNDSWVYEEFGEDDGLRTGAWAYTITFNRGYSGRPSPDPSSYTANRNTDADPWEELGIHIYCDGYQSAIATWTLYNLCGITAVNFTNGEYYSDGDDVSLETIPDESSIAITQDSTWRSWSQNDTGLTSTYTVGFEVALAGITYDDYKTFNVEVADITVTLDNTYTPDSSIGSEQSNYQLSATLKNNATGDSITINYNMALDESLEIDTEARIVTDLENDSYQLQAIASFNTVRKQWLPLDPGDNELEYTETGAQGVTVDIEYRERSRS